MKKGDAKLQVYDLNGKAVDSIQLDAKLFDGKVNKRLLYEVIKMYEANNHRGTVSAKTRAEVKGGGAKPWRQKGTGRARVGSSRNPIWRHGGVTFAPKPRDFGYSLPKTALKKALLSVLNARITEDMIKPVVKIELEEAKTKTFNSMLDKLKVEGKTLIIVDTMSDAVKLSSRNIKRVSLKEGKNVNARDILLNEYLVIEKDALEKMAERLK